jgi:hypothetical protein
MSKPVFAMLLGGILGVFDGLISAAVGGPEIPSMIGQIVAARRSKASMRGLTSALVARRRSRPSAIVGVALWSARFFAYLVTIGGPYFWEIILPGSLWG